MNDIPPPDDSCKAEQEAVDAFNVHAALLRAQRDAPSLADNPLFTMMKQDAYERFHIAFEKCR